MLLDKVKINRDVSKSRYKHLLKQIEEGIVTEEDLRLVQKWFEVGRFAPVQTRWKKVFSSGVKLVGFDSEPETLLGKLESAYGIDLDTWENQGTRSDASKWSPKSSLITSRLTAKFLHKK